MGLSVLLLWKHVQTGLCHFIDNNGEFFFRSFNVTQIRVRREEEEVRNGQMKGRKRVKEIILPLILFRILRSLIWNFGGESFWKMATLTEKKKWGQF